MSSFEQSYVGQLRKLVGNRRLLTPSARAIIRNADGATLFIRRRDNGQWAPPAGFMEMGETVYDAMCREINEETGLEVLAATLVSIYSGPKLMRTNQYGSEHQHLVFQFRVDDWTGRAADRDGRNDRRRLLLAAGAPGGFFAVRVDLPRPGRVSRPGHPEVGLSVEAREVTSAHPRYPCQVSKIRTSGSFGSSWATAGCSRPA